MTAAGHPQTSDLSRTARSQETPVLFQSPLCRMILAGRKTQTRRLVKPGKDGAAPRCFYRAGSSHPLTRPMRLDEANEIQAAIILGSRRGRPPKKEVGRITITAVERGPLGEIGFDAARAEGFRTPTAFKAYWVRLHDSRWIRRFVHDPAPGIGPCPEQPSDEDLAERFAERWAAVEVWAITFQVEPTVLYLAERPQVSGDYVSTERDQRGRQIAMTSEIVTHPVAPAPVAPGVPSWSHGGLLRVGEEAVHPDIIDGWQHDARSTHRQIQTRVRERGESTRSDQRDLELRHAGMEARIRAAKTLARHHGTDLHAELAVYRQARLDQRGLGQLESLVQAIETRAQAPAPRRAVA
jgi:hypothetical protein